MPAADQSKAPRTRSSTLSSLNMPAGGTQSTSEQTNGASTAQVNSTQNTQNQNQNGVTTKPNNPKKFPSLLRRSSNTLNAAANGVQQRPSLPSRPSAPVPGSVEHSEVSSVRSMRRITPQTSPGLNQSNLNQSNAPPGVHGRERGMTITPRRATSLVFASEKDVFIDQSALPNNLPYPAAQTESTPPRTAPSAFSRHTTYAYAPSVPWSSTGSLHSQTQPGGLVWMAHPDLPPSNTGSVWEGDGNTEFSMETEVQELDDLDEEVAEAIQGVQIAHLNKVTQFKRLFEQAQFNSAFQLHALQAELRLLKTTLDSEREAFHQIELARDRDRLANAFNRVNGVDHEEDADLARALRGDGKGTFNDSEVKRAVRSLKMADRMRLISIILDSCIPGDISQQIRLLEKYQKSTFDILGHLSSDIAVSILRYLSVPQLLGVETVCKKWRELVHHPAIWRHHCLVLTSTDPVPVRPPAKLEEWESLYRSLHHRESNWKHALPQQIRFLNGHTNFCTTLLLKGKRLFSGSYDETIRVWDIETGEEQKCLSVKKPVSCLDFLVEEEVFAVGFHDVGRVHLFSSVTYNPLQQLQGHLYGIKAIALSSKYLVSAGADKALVCWDWRQGSKVVRFGQQTNLNIGVQILGTGAGADEIGERFVSVTIDGTVRVFSISRREMISQFTLSHLGIGDPVLSPKISTVGAGANNMLQWFAAKGNQMTCATKTIILHLEWDEIENNPAPVNGSSTTSSPTSSGPRTPSSSFSTPIRSVSSSTLKSSIGLSVNGSAPRKSTGPPRLSLPSSSTPRTPSNQISNLTSPRGPPPSALPGSNGHKRRASLSSYAAPPKVLAVVETPDIAVGAVDPMKRRVITSTRFSTRTGADRRIFISTHKDKVSSSAPDVDGSLQEDDVDTPTLEEDRMMADTLKVSKGNSRTKSPRDVDFDTEVEALGGVWGELAIHENGITPADLKEIDGVNGALPSKFKGLATAAMNPMAFALSHEEVVVGCADGSIYVMNFVGYKYTQQETSSVSPTEYLGDSNGRYGPAADSANLLDSSGLENSPL